MEQFIANMSKLNQHIFGQQISSLPPKVTSEDSMPSPEPRVSLIWPVSNDADRESLCLYRAMDMAG